MADDPNVALTVTVLINQQQATQASNSLRQIQNDVVKTADTFKSLEKEGRNLRELGANLATSAAAILGPLTLAADKYAKTYAGIERQANQFIAAEKRQESATNDLGRSVSSALLPRLNELADITEKIANFAARNPAAVQTAVDVASAVAVAGGTMVALGQATSMLGRIEQVTKSGGLVGGITQSIVAIGALAAGAKIAEAGIQKFGEATNNQALAQFQLSDALKTARQMIAIAVVGVSQAFVEAKKTVGELILYFDGLKTQIGVSIDRMLDTVATAFRVTVLNFQTVLDQIRIGFQNMINGLIQKINETFGTSIGQLGGVYYDKGQSPEEKAAAEKAGFASRQQGRDTTLQLEGVKLSAAFDTLNQTYKQDQENLKKIADFASNFAATGTLGPVGDAIGNGIKALIGKIGDTINAQTAPIPGAAGGLGAVSPDALKAFVQYQKDVTKAVNDEAKKEKEEKVKLANELTAIDVKERDEELKANSEFEAKQKADQAKFTESELAEDARTARERLRKQNDINSQLTDLAAARDVAGFVAAQKAGAEQLKQFDEDAADAKKQRQKQFADQQNEAKVQHDKQIQDLRAAAQREKDAKQQAYDEQLQALRQALQNQKNALLQSFAEQLAQIAPSIAGLGDLVIQSTQQKITEFNNWLAANAPALRNAIVPGSGSSTPYIPTTTYYTPQTFQTTSQQTTSLARKLGVPSFDSGISSLPRDMLILAHEGERITRRVDNHGGPTVNVYMDVTAGDVASKTFVQDTTAGAISAIRGNLKQLLTAGQGMSQ